MRRVTGLVISAVLLLSTTSAKQTPAGADKNAPQVLGYLDPARQEEIDKRFLAVPDAARAREHLRILTSAPHVAGSPEDRKTAEYVAQQFRDAGLETEIVEYKVWLPYPTEVHVDITAPKKAVMRGPRPEQVDGDPYQNHPRVIAAFNGYSTETDIEADVVYAHFGRPEDFETLAQMGVDVKGKIAIIRYGDQYRGVKTSVAQQYGAAGVILYSDPQQDGYFQGDTYPKGPWRPASGVQRGSVGYMFFYPGDPSTPGFASTPTLPDSKRIAPLQAASYPKIPTTPLSSADATPILENLGGPSCPHAWQGALPFTYHLGPGPARVHIRLKNDGKYRTIWDVIGKVRGSERPDEWVVAGNHRDAWVFGAVDPSSGTAAMLEAVHGIGVLLKSGWKPKRTVVFGSWDAEEWGLIGSVEWAEEHEKELSKAVAYLNMDSAVSGPRFAASAVPVLKEFVRDITKSVPAADGKGSVYDAWRRAQEEAKNDKEMTAATPRRPFVELGNDVPVGDLGSGSDFTPFFQHLGIVATDVNSNGPYGVYHSVFDNPAWFEKFGDPEFRYEQQMARVFGLEAIRLASADVLPFDFETYGKEISAYIQALQKRSEAAFGAKSPSFTIAAEASRRLTDAGAAMNARRKTPQTVAELNNALLEANRQFLLPNGLPERPWFRHAIYAPGRYTGYAAAVLPAIDDAITAQNMQELDREIGALADALKRAAATLEGVH